MTPQSMSEVHRRAREEGPDRAQPASEPPARLSGGADGEGRRVLAACNAAVDELEHEMLAGLSPHQERQLAQRALIVAVRALHAGFPMRQSTIR